jgi:outer membrane beta-barrel protein
MESWIRIFLLESFLLLAFAVQAADDNPAPAPATQGEQFNQMLQQEPVIQPDIKRRQVKEAKIDTENFEVGVFAGILSIEDFGSNPIYGARLIYHVTEDFFFEGTVGFSEGGETSYEVLTNTIPLLTDEQRKYTFYTATIGYNLLPGEAFIGRNTAFNTALYIVGGIGSTEFGGEDRFTVVFGGGYRIIIKDWLAIHATVRDYTYSIDITGEEKNVNNIEISLGATYFF